MVLSEIIISLGVYWDSEFINEQQICDTIIDNYPQLEPTPHDLDDTAASLVVGDYIDMWMAYDPSDRTTHTFVKATKLGMKAALDGEFWFKWEKRKIDIRNLELIESTIESHKQQKFINWGLVITAFLAVLSPIAVALWFDKPHNVITNPPYDIRKDSVWIQGLIDTSINKNKEVTQTPK